MGTVLETGGGVIFHEGLPKGSLITGMFWNPEQQLMSIYYEHPSLPDVPEGAPCTEVKLQCNFVKANFHELPKAVLPEDPEPQFTDFKGKPRPLPFNKKN
jgi:hypothetical protein